MVDQISTFEELQPFEIATFDLSHPVCLYDGGKFLNICEIKLNIWKTTAIYLDFTKQSKLSLCERICKDGLLKAFLWKS